MAYTKKRYLDYLEFRALCLKHNIKSLAELAKFLGYQSASVSERFSHKQKWTLKDLKYMSIKWNVTIDELVEMLEA